MRIDRISEDLEGALEQFLDSCGSSLDSFRYFSSRPLSVVHNHLVSLLAFEDDLPVAYGHLDPENDTVWLGICVAESAQGRGYGNAMMERLLQEARTLGIERISLSVDKANQSARKLYEKHGFRLVKELNDILFYCREHDSERN